MSRFLFVALGLEPGNRRNLRFCLILLGSGAVLGFVLSRFGGIENADLALPVRLAAAAASTAAVSAIAWATWDYYRGADELTRRVYEKAAAAAGAASVFIMLAYAVVGMFFPISDIGQYGGPVVVSLLFVGFWTIFAARSS